MFYYRTVELLKKNYRCGTDLIYKSTVY